MTNFIIIVISFYFFSTTAFIWYLFRQDTRCHKAGIYLFAAGFVCHLVLFAYDYLITGHIPTQNLRGTLIFAALAFAAIFKHYNTCDSFITTGNSL